MIARAAWCAGLAAFAASVAGAQAHVTIDPPVLAGGSYGEIVFRCPNERAAAATTELRVQLPPDRPIRTVLVRPVPGWRSSVTMRRGAVDTIAWRGGPIHPGEYQNFAILAGPLPRAPGVLIFKAVQTYSNGEVVRWIQLRQPGEPEPPNPAPVLTLRP